MRKVKAVFTAIILASLMTSGFVLANNLAAFEALANGRWKKLKNQSEEDFLKKYGTPTKSKKEEKDGVVTATHFYTETGCRYRFTFVNRIFKSAVRNCM